MPWMFAPLQEGVVATVFSSDSVSYWPLVTAPVHLTVGGEACVPADDFQLSFQQVVNKLPLVAPESGS